MRYALHLRRALDFLKIALPRTLVNLVPAIGNQDPIYFYTNRKQYDVYYYYISIFFLDYYFFSIYYNMRIFVAVTYSSFSLLLI